MHGYQDRCGQIHIKIKLYGDHTVEIRVRDNGRGIDDIKKAREPLFTTGDAERSGMGFTIMESFSDKLRVSSVPEKGTTVTLFKRISGKSNDSRKN